ncbi:MAG TPA: hypothetical protein VLW53_22945 [Candidatus Eisenbacteria bacterium]|nr:hypothetical protein [Candidatus Eisenbacteria bacterium]
MSHDAVTVLGHLADERRLRVFAAVLLGPSEDSAAVARRAAVGGPDAVRVLARLEAAGLVARSPR